MYFSIPLIVGYISDRNKIDINELQTVVSITLILSAILSPLIGRYTDRTSGKFYLTIWSFVSSFAFAMLIYSNSLLSIGLFFLINQIAASLCIYEAIFPPIVRMSNGDRSTCNRVMNLIVISCGLSPSLFWPICEYVKITFGCNYLLGLLSFMNAFICVPIYLICFRNDTTERAPKQKTPIQAQPFDNSKEFNRLVLVSLFLCVASYTLNGIYYNIKYLCEFIAFPSQNIGTYGGAISFGAIAIRLMYIRYDTVISVNIQIMIVIYSFIVLAITFITGGGVLMLISFLLMFGVCQSNIMFLRTSLPADGQNASNIGQKLGILGLFRKLAVACAPMGMNFQEHILGAKLNMAFLCFAVILSALSLVIFGKSIKRI